MNSNTELLRWVNAFARATPWLHALVFAYATYGLVLFALLLLAGWWLARRSTPTAMAAALWAPIGMLVAVGLNQPIVSAVGERRPYAVLPDLLVLATRTTDPSFPSDHAVMAGAVAAGLMLVSWRLGVVATAAALVMALARVYIAAHYPLDVAVGLVFGAAVSLLGYLVLRALLVRAVLALRRTPLRPLLTTAGDDRDTEATSSAAA